VTDMERTFKIRINGDLRGTPLVRVIASDGEMLGVMTLAEALRVAMKEGRDLVEVNPKADPPVCKILDFGKYKYAEKRKAAETTKPEPEDEE
jgi:translation initiation factor IF-3